MTDKPPESGASGLPHALGAYLIWGFLPLYLILVREVPAFEFVGWRILWTIPLCWIIIALRNQWPEVKRALANRRTFATLFVSSALIGVNWFVYVWAIQQGHVYAASLGYYINPLFNVLLGTWLLGERLSRQQWLAAAIAACGVVLLLGGAITTLWISLSLAVSFGIYGLLRRQVDVGSLPGLTIEAMLLAPVAIPIVWWFAAQPDGSSFGKDWQLSFYIILGGVATAAPLLLFAIAARRLHFSTLGFLQFLGPTIIFILGLTVFKEELQFVQLASFIMIWIAVGLFVADLLRLRAS